MSEGFILDFPLILDFDDSFRLEFHLTQGDTLEFERGIYYLSGDNGSGKTSFVNMLSLVSGRIGKMPNMGNGSISFRGAVYSDEKFSHIRAAEIREKYFCIFPQKAFFLPVSTRDNYLILDGSDKKKTEQFSSREYPDQLSGGQQQRVLMDIVLNENKPIWFLDEPLSNMDRENRIYFWKKMERAFKAGVQIIFFIEHWMDSKIKKEACFQHVNRIQSSGYRENTRHIKKEDAPRKIDIYKCDKMDNFFSKFFLEKHE